MSKHGMSSRLASQVKRGGHLREQIFSNQFSNYSMININRNVNYTGSTADCFINKLEYVYIITELNVPNGETSVKGGSTYQFHLGKLPELIDYDSLIIERQPSERNKEKFETCFVSNITNDQQLLVLSDYGFWKKYLGKGELLALDVENHWHFFSMREVINLLINPQRINWRFLKTGRIKGDLIFPDNRRRAGITFEHRFEKNQSVLGAHGGTSGIDIFFPWLRENISKSIRIKKMSV
jgi:hypothetical protein